MDLLAADRQLFVLVNQNGLHNSWTDAAKMAVSSHIFWILLGLSAAAYTWRKGDPRLWWVLGAILVAAGVGDSFSAYILKPWIARLRPCHELAAVLLPTGRCGGLFGFPSNHAVNAGVAAGALIVLRRFFATKFIVFAVIMALLVAFSRVWLGVHYPLDVTAGLILGLLLGSAAGAACLHPRALGSRA